MHFFKVEYDVHIPDNEFSGGDCHQTVDNHSLLPLSCLPRKRVGEKIRKEAIFWQGVVERNGNAATEDRAFFNTPARNKLKEV
ncbi:MAG: hypothetical protein JO071_14470 [Deltaproteobacteria bacterium]|nr:hypothetical protein [Deltaproteobacteria bacterium]